MGTSPGSAPAWRLGTAARPASARWLGAAAELSSRPTPAGMRLAPRQLGAAGPSLLVCLALSPSRAFSIQRHSGRREETRGNVLEVPVYQYGAACGPRRADAMGSQPSWLPSMAPIAAALRSRAYFTCAARMSRYQVTSSLQGSFTLDSAERKATTVPISVWPVTTK